MEKYFDSSAGGWGLFCWDETMSPKRDELFKDMTTIHNKALEAVGGKYIPQDYEPEYEAFPRDHKLPCAIRLARATFFKVRDQTGPL